MLSVSKEQKINKLADLLDVIADPICMRVILNLTKPTSVEELQKRLSIGQITLLRRLNHLQRNGLLQSEYRDNEIYYSLRDITLSNAIKLLL